MIGWAGGKWERVSEISFIYQKTSISWSIRLLFPSCRKVPLRFVMVTLSKDADEAESEKQGQATFASRKCVLDTIGRYAANTN